MTHQDIVIRRATEGDLQIIVDLNQALFDEDAGPRDPFMNLNWPQIEGQEYFTKHVRSSKSLGLLAETKGTVIGYLVGFMKGS